MKRWSSIVCSHIDSMSAYGGVGCEGWLAVAVVEVCVEFELSEESLREGEDGGEI